RHDDGARLVLYVAYYAEQRAGSQMVTSSNRLAFKEETGPVNWQLVSRQTVEMPPGRILRTLIADRHRILAIWHWYWSHGALETSDRRAKIAFAIRRLTGRADDAAFVAVL
ncbi:EpsI family protein, partial [Arthrospira platensis SPKY1]|nr:EpsI family protein [Arthrospira platensis SPKY1]